MCVEIDTLCIYYYDIGINMPWLIMFALQLCECLYNSASCDNPVLWKRWVTILFTLTFGCEVEGVPLFCTQSVWVPNGPVIKPTLLRLKMGKGPVNDTGDRFSPIDMTICFNKTLGKIGLFKNDWSYILFFGAKTVQWNKTNLCVVGWLLILNFSTYYKLISPHDEI